MTGRSLLPILLTSQQGLVDPARDHVITGRERHVASVRQGNLPYPQRAIRTSRFLLIRNFDPGRWPMGEAPGYGRPTAPMPPFETLRETTTAAFGDLDASPTKAWLITHRDDPGMQTFFDYAFARRPEFELYDLDSDPDCLTNLADDPRYAETRQSLTSRLMEELRATGDPRATGDDMFDRPPLTDPVQRR